MSWAWLRTLGWVVVVYVVFENWIRLFGFILNLQHQVVRGQR